MILVAIAGGQRLGDEHGVAGSIGELRQPRLPREAVRLVIEIAKGAPTSRRVAGGIDRSGLQELAPNDLIIPFCPPKPVPVRSLDGSQTGPRAIKRFEPHP